MKKLARLGGIAALALSLISGETSFAADNIEVIVNNSPATPGTSPYLAYGTTMVPLNVVQQIPGISVSWDNSTKTVTITDGGKVIKLIAGQKTAAAGSGSIALSTPSSLQQGRVMVPLRFVAEVSGAYVTWNPLTRTVYVAKADDKLKDSLGSGNLTEARRAALLLPRVSMIRDFKPTPSSMEGQTSTYYFPEGEHNRFLIWRGDIASYYEAVNGRSQLLWTARLAGGAKTDGVLFFQRTKALEESGVRPVPTSRFVYFHVMPHIGAASYGFINPDGTSTELGIQDVTMNAEVVDIPEELE